MLSLKENKKKEIIKEVKAKKSKIDKEKKQAEKEKIKKENKIKTQNNRKIRKLIEDWDEIMFQTGMYNQYDEIFTLSDIVVEEFGFKANLHCPKGLTFKSLETILSVIEDNLQCIFIYNKSRLDDCMEVRIVQRISKDRKFKPPQTKPWEMYIGDQFDGTPIIVNLNDWCQVMLTGTTGSGKSKLLDCALATQVYNHMSTELELYLLQLDKCDLALYEDSRICRGFADNLDKAIVILEHLKKELDKRNALVKSVKKKGKGSNITDYNKVNPMNTQSTIWVVLDEMASIHEKPSDNEVVKHKKKYIDDMLAAIAQFGRSNNVFLICCIQRPTADMINSFTKAMCNLKIAFKASNSKSSEVATDDAKIALDLEKRVAVYKLLSYDFLQTPWIDDPLIMKYIGKMQEPNHYTIFESKWGNEKLQEVKTMGKKEEKSNKKNNTPPQEQTGKEDVAKELELKKKEEELKKKEEYLRQLEEYNKRKQDDINKIPKVMPITEKDKEFGKVDPSVQNKMLKNIGAIPNFVPYQPPSTEIKIIDQTIYNPSKTSKPQKGKERIK